MSGFQIVPADVEKLICDWSMKTLSPLTTKQLNTLTAFVFNGLFSDRQVHTVPNDNEHCETRFCFCQPRLSHKDEFNNIEHWVHSDTRTDALN